MPKDLNEIRDSNIEGAEERVRALFSPLVFKQTAEIVSAELFEYFSKPSMKERVRQWTDPSQLAKWAREQLCKGELDKNLEPANSQNERVRELVQHYLQTNHHLHSPHYMGHQVPPPLLMTGPIEMIGASTNQAPGLYEMGPLPVAAEKAVTSEMCKLLGWDEDQFGAIGTSGGSLANLTAILAARNHRYKDIWSVGLAQIQGKLNRRPAIAVGADSHYSVLRSAGVLGLGTDQVLKVDLDSKRRMNPQSLEKVLVSAEKQDLDIFCVVATSGSTPVGAYDDLRAISQITQKFKVWLHVDGAHGASVLFSNKYRHLCSGIELADSVVWDAHKMLYVPALSTFVFYRDKKTMERTFQQDAPYLNDAKSERAASFDTYGATLECTKKPIAMSLWALWAVYGPGIFEDLTNVTFQHAQDFYHIIEASDDFEALHAPESNILCFRHLPVEIKAQSEEIKGEFQKKIREELVKDGAFYTTATKLNGKDCLRVTLINPLTTSQDLKNLLERYRSLGKKFLKF